MCSVRLDSARAPPLTPGRKAVERKGRARTGTQGSLCPDWVGLRHSPLDGALGSGGNEAALLLGESPGITTNAGPQRPPATRPVPP